MSNIILVSGATGVGTSKLSLELAKTHDIQTIVSTDMIREVLRSVLNNQINPALEVSSYQVGQTKNYKYKSSEVQKAEIIRGYKYQSRAINVGVKGIIERAKKENIDVIIEGLHLIPGNLYENDFFKNSDFYEFLVTIEDQNVHKKRFVSRQKMSPKRKTTKYLKNFKEIRWIHDYLLNRASRFKHICKVDNTYEVSLAINKMKLFMGN